MKLRYLKKEDCPATETGKYSCEDAPGGGMECVQSSKSTAGYTCKDCLDNCSNDPGNYPDDDPDVDTDPDVDPDPKNQNTLFTTLKKYGIPIVFGVLLLCLLIWYFTRPKKNNFSVYWRR